MYRILAAQTGISIPNECFLVACTLRRVTQRQIGQEIIPSIRWNGQKPSMFIYSYQHRRGKFYQDIVYSERREQAIRIIRERHPDIEFRFYR